MIDAYLSLDSNLPLVISGNKAWLYEEELRRLKSDPALAKKIRLLGYIPDEYREALYKGALAFAFPSLCEGFGIPVLDAAVCGCPVLASDIESLREICGDAAVYVDPTDITAIASGLRRIIAEGGLRSELSAAARERSSFFSLERHRANLENAYHEAVISVGKTFPVRSNFSTVAS